MDFLSRTVRSRNTNDSISTGFAPLVRIFTTEYTRVPPTAASLEISVVKTAFRAFAGEGFVI